MLASQWTRARRTNDRCILVRGPGDWPWNKTQLAGFVLTFGAVARCRILGKHLDLELSTRGRDLDPQDHNLQDRGAGSLE